MLARLDVIFLPSSSSFFFLLAAPVVVYTVRLATAGVGLDP